VGAGNNALKRILVDGGYIEGGNYYFYITDHLGNNRIVTDAAASVVQSTQYYPFGTSFADASGTSTQPYKYNGKELDARNGLNMHDYGARWKPDWYFTTVDPLAEKYYSISPYAYCNNNPMRFIDPTGMDYGEYDFINGEWKKISNIGDNIGVDFYHMRGVTNESGKEITNVTDRQGNWIEMADGRNILKGGGIRGANTNWETIYNEWKSGTGPAKSVFEGNHEANKSIQEHYLYEKAYNQFKDSGEPKVPYKIDWGFTDVFKTGTSNMQAQMMGSYNISF
jgi:RHS repeat-associated protein